MATISFNQLDDLLNGKRAQDTLSTAPGVQANPELPGYSGNMGQESAGFAGGGGGAQKFSSGPKAKDPMAIIEANKGAPALNLAEEATKNVQKATQGLQSQADAYVGKVGATGTKPLERSVLDDLFSGGAKAGDAAGKVRSRLDETFAPEAFSVDSKESWDAQAFTDPAKLKALRRETGNQKFQGGYTSGMQALDEAVERRSPQDYSGVLKASQDFRTEAQKAQDRGNQAAEAAKGRFGEETAGIRATLSGRASEVDKELGSRLSGRTADDAKEVGRLREDAIKTQRKEAEVDSLRSRIADYRKNYPKADISDLENQLATLEADIGGGKYVDAAAPTRTRDDVASNEERVAFNLINELLGTGTRLGQGMEARPTVSTRDVKTPANTIRAALDSLFKARADEKAAFDAQVARNAPPPAEPGPVRGDVRAPMPEVVAPPPTTGPSRLEAISAPQYDSINWGGGLGGIASDDEVARLVSGETWAPPPEAVPVPTVRGEPGVVPTTGPGTAAPMGSTERAPLAGLGGKIK
jgi:hypothetical protein